MAKLNQTGWEREGDVGALHAAQSAAAAAAVRPASIGCPGHVDSGRRRGKATRAGPLTLPCVPCRPSGARLSAWERMPSPAL